MQDNNESDDSGILVNRSCNQKIQNLLLSSDSSQQPVRKTTKSQRQQSQDCGLKQLQALDQQWRRIQSKKQRESLMTKNEANLDRLLSGLRKPSKDNLEFGASIVSSQEISIQTSFFREQSKRSKTKQTVRYGNQIRIIPYQLSSVVSEQINNIEIHGEKVDCDSLKEESREWSKMKGYISLGLAVIGVGVVGFIYWTRIKSRQ